MGNKPSRHHGREVAEETIFKSSKNEVYRIPALFYDREKKTLLAFTEKRRTTDDSSTEELVMKTGMVTKDETTHEVKIKWSTPSTIVKKDELGGYRPMNPCPVYDKTTKTLFLFFIRVEGNVSECWQLFWGCNRARLCYVTTKDAGQSWSGVTDLTDKLAEIKNWSTFAVGPGHGLQTENGRLIVPTYAYYSSKFKKTTPYALALYKDKSDTDWQFGKMLQNESLECEMAEFVDDTQPHKSFIYCNARSKGGFREEAVSANYGDDFSNMSGDKELVETGKGCQGSVVSFPAQSEDAHADGDSGQGPNKWLLFTHPTHKSKRIDLGVYLNKSPQDRNAWSKPWIINSGPSGYSDLAYIDDGWFACLMECGMQKYTEQIALKVFRYKDIKQGIGK